METFTLVVSLMLFDVPWEQWRDYHQARTPGLGWDECVAAAKLVQPPQRRAYCDLEGAPAPAWTKRLPGVERAPICAACGAIPGYNPA